MDRKFNTWAVADEADAGCRIEVASNASLDEGATIRTICEPSILSSGVEYHLGVNREEVQVLEEALEEYLRLAKAASDDADDWNYDAEGTLRSLLARLAEIRGYQAAEPTPESRVMRPQEVGRSFMVARFDVTGLSDAEKTALAFHVGVQEEGSDGNGDERLSYPDVSSDITWEGADAAPEPDEYREVLVHYNVSVAADDPRTAAEIADDLTEAINGNTVVAGLNVTMALADEV